MLHFLSSLFATSSRRDDPVDKALLEHATERVLEGSDPRLRALPGYRKRLRAPVETAVRHVIDLVGRLPEPAEISRQAFRNDPRLRAFFVSPEHLQETMAGCPMMSDYLRGANPAAGDVIFGLLSMTRSEKNILGMDLQGDTLQRDVAQVAVNFSDHRYLGPSGDETETRRELMRRGFDFLIERALESIIATRSKQAELDQQRQLLQRKLRAMEAGNWGLEAAFAPSEAGGGADLVALEAEIQAVENELLTLGSKPHALEHSLEQNITEAWELIQEPDTYVFLAGIGKIAQALDRVMSRAAGNAIGPDGTELNRDNTRDFHSFRNFTGSVAGGAPSGSWQRRHRAS